MDTVTTVQGDTWDTVAYRVYGNALCAQALMEARENVPLLDIQRFPAGIIIAVPEVEAPSTGDGLPEWRR